MLAGHPLISHSIRMAQMTPEIDDFVVSTDSEEIAAVARKYDCEVPFLRPAELAQDDTPMLPVLQHAVQEMERLHGKHYGTVLLLDPTSPGRLPEDVTTALAKLESDEKAAGIVAASEPHFNPRWVCVEERDGYMHKPFAAGQSFSRRQDVPPIYRINGSLYLWRRNELMNATGAWDTMPHKLLVIPEERAIHIDELHDFAMAELVLREKMVLFPWLYKG